MPPYGSVWKEDGEMKIRVILFLFLLVSKTCFAQNSPIVINEVLANEPGSSTKLEWVELYNWDSTSHSLDGYIFLCKNDTTIFPPNLILPAKGFLVLVRQLLSESPDTVSFEGIWGNRSGIWGDSPEEKFLVLQAKFSLNNSSGNVSLVDYLKNIQTFTWGKDVGDGTSWEKIYPQAGDSISNWGMCVYPQKSTPGKENSVTPAENDLEVSSQTIGTEPPLPKSEENFLIWAEIKNVGTKSSLSNLITFYLDSNLNNTPEEEEKIFEPLPISPLNHDTSQRVGIQYSLQEGSYKLFVKISDDDKPSNNSASIFFKVGSELPDIIINEFIPNPDINQTEWVELYNRSQETINLKNWRLGDSQKQNIITSEDLELSPGQYLIVSQEVAKLTSTFPSLFCKVIEQSDWEILNNDADAIILKDSLNLVEEQFSYNYSWAKGISWERINSEKLSSDTTNWWRSVASSGATPCEKNSISTNFSPKIELKVSPNPFSPDNDGFEDETAIFYNLPSKSELTLKIYDIKGRLVKTFFKDTPAVSGEIIWDGKDENNRVLKAGIYIIFVEIQGEIKASAKTTVVIVKR
jgi:hypothetical protein